MYLKLMGGWAIPDHDTRQTFRVLSNVSAVSFERYRGPEEPAWRPVAEVTFEDGSTESFEMRGNAYLMNGDGKTIAQFAKESPPDDAYNYQFSANVPPDERKPWCQATDPGCDWPDCPCVAK